MSEDREAVVRSDLARLHAALAQARREGAAEALEAAATDVLLDDSAGDYGTHVWLKMRAKAFRGDA